MRVGPIGSPTMPLGVPGTHVLITQGEMIQLVCGRAGLLPHAHAKVAVLRWASGIHHFCSIAVPNHECVVYDSIRNRNATTVFAVNVTCQKPTIVGSHWT